MSNRIRAAEVEVLITADATAVAAAEQQVKNTGDRISKKPIDQKIKGDPKDAIEAMEQVEEAAKKLVSKDTALRLDADIERSEQQLEKVRARLEGLEVKALGGLDVTASTKRAETELRRIERTLTALQSAKTQIAVDPGEALAAIEQVERAGARLVSKRFAVRMNAEVDKAQADVEQLEKSLASLRALSPSIDVDASITKAESNLREAKGKLDELEGRRATMVVDVSDRFARQQLAGVSEVAGKAGDDSGKEFNRNIIAALAGIPIAGAVLGVGILAGKALIDGLQDGLQQEVGRDRLQGLTGIDEASALRLSRIAGEAYTRGFGESIEQNMDITRLGIQFQLIPADATQRDAQKVIEGLGGIADALGEDVRPVATTVTTLLRTGLARSASEAFDILAIGQQRGLNRADDLLDTFQEYPVVLRRLGLDAEDSLGLLNQGLVAGARNSDVVADALKEFQIRGSDASEASAKGYERIGLSATEMTAKVAAGGEGAREALGLVLDRLRETEDPVIRNAAAVELFGTKAEDLGEALFALDPRTAAEGLGLVEGAARRMFETLSDNDASRIDQAKRNIEVAADGIKGALAAAFSEPLGELATFVSENRGPVSEFLLSLVTGALDFGEAMVNAAADGTEAFGEFLAGPGADAIDTLAALQESLSLNPFDRSELRDVAEDMRSIDTTAAATADTIRDRLIAQGLDPARERVLAFGEGVVQMGYLNDASLRLAQAVADVGYKADGTKLSLDGVDTANLRGSESGREFARQVRDAVGALGEEIDAAAAAGEAQDVLTGRYNAGVGALISQMTQMGLTEEQARALIDTVLETPGTMTTAFGSNAVAEQGKVDALANRIRTLPNGQVVIMADTTEARLGIDSFIDTQRQRRIRIAVDAVGGETYQIAGTNVKFQRDGGLLEFMAAGGLRGLNPMQPIAQVVPPSTWRVVGDRSDVAESYIPLDGSARSMAILLETMRRMGLALPMAAGGVLDRGSVAVGGAPTYVDVKVVGAPGDDRRILARVTGDEVKKAIRRR